MTNGSSKGSRSWTASVVPVLAIVAASGAFGFLLGSVEPHKASQAEPAMQNMEAVAFGGAAVGLARLRVYPGLHARRLRDSRRSPGDGARAVSVVGFVHDNPRLCGMAVVLSLAVDVGLYLSYDALPLAAWSAVNAATLVLGAIIGNIADVAHYRPDFWDDVPG